MSFDAYYKDHEHDMSGLRQTTIRVRGERMLAFETYCVICGVIENPNPIGSEVS